MYPDFHKLAASSGKYVGTDIETTLIDEHGAIEKIWSIAWHNGLETKSVFWRNGITKPELANKFSNIETMVALSRDPQGELLLELKQLLVGETEYVPAFHSAQFDARHLQECLDVPMGPYICTQQLAYIILPPAVMGSTGDEDALRFYRLSHLASMGLCDAKLDYEGGFEHFSDEMLSYNEQDAVSCWQIAHRFMPMLNPQLTMAFIIDMCAQRMAFEMQVTGCLIDQDKLHELTLKYEQELVRIENEMRELLPAVLSEKSYQFVHPPKPTTYAKVDGIYEASDIGRYLVVGTQGGKTIAHKVEAFDPSKKDHVLTLIKRYCAWEPRKFSRKTGAVTLDKAVLEELADMYYPAKLMLDYRKYGKLLSTYMKPFRRTDEFGRMHPSFLTCATRTSRFASRGPNFQNIPKGDCRSLIIAPPGYKIVCIDLSQIELRILAWYMAVALKGMDSATFMWEQFAQGADIHDANSKKMKKERKLVKVGIFLYIYGGNEPRMAASLGISLPEAKSFMNALEKELPALPAIRRYFHEAAIRNRTLYTMYGHQISYPKLFAANTSNGERKQCLRQYFNAGIQGSQADIMKVVMWQCRKPMTRFGANLLMQVHDELVFEVPEGNAALFCEAIFPLFNNTYLLKGLIIKALPGIGDSWLEAKEDGERREDDARKSVQAT